MESVLVAVSDHVVGLKRDVRLEAFAGMADQISLLHLCDRAKVEGTGAGFDLLDCASGSKQLDEVFVAAYQMYSGAEVAVISLEYVCPVSRDFIHPSIAWDGVSLP